MITREVLLKLSEEDLRSLQRMIQEELERRKRESKKEFEFHFEATSYVPKWRPYVARLVVKNGKIERQFKNLERVNGKKQITVFGQYTASVGDVIEKRHGGSWKNEYRYWYLITEDGREIEVADIDSSKQKQKVIEYMKGNITANELLESVPAARK